MTTTKYHPILLFFSLLLHCATPQPQQTLWIAGIQSNCAAGAGQRSCMLVHRSTDPEGGEWEYFYTDINGFTYEEGIAKRIVVTTQRSDPQQTPADASAIQYTLVRELERRSDPRAALTGDWNLARLRGNPLNRMVPAPTLTIDLAARRISGNGGCNTYSAPIEQIALADIDWGNVMRTEKACLNKNIESEYFQALEQVSRYGREGDLLVFYAASGEQLLSFMPQQDPAPANERLHDIWAATRIEGSPIDRSSPVPSLEINLTKMRIFGNDGCNEYNGAIETATATQLSFGTIAATKKMCRDMTLPERYNRALKRVDSYRLEGLNLILLDAAGAEVLAFLKVD